MRVRWGNVGRAAAVVGVLALAVAWPRMEGGAPRLPSDVARPVAVAASPAGTARVRKEPGAGRRPGVRRLSGRAVRSERASKTQQRAMRRERPRKTHQRAM